MSNFYIKDLGYSEEQIANLKQFDLFNFNRTRMPKSLFKYFPNDEDNTYSLDALKNNTVYLSSPKDFDDPYDCNVFIEEEDFALQRIRYYASLCGVKIKDEWNYIVVANNLADKIYQHISSGKPIKTLFQLDEENKLVHERQKRFLLTLEIDLSSPSANRASYHTAINKVIAQELDKIQETANRFRVSCFTQNPYSMLMWAHYARCHKGFCVGYELPDYSNDNASIYHNLFPVIYTDTRISLTELNLNWESTGKLTDSDLCDFYKYCLLSKSLDWKYQQEWRLISYDNFLTDDSYNCKFFNIKKVYLGNKMPVKDRLKVIDICKNKSIPYTGLTIAPEQFKMKDCSILCEDCYKIREKMPINET